MRSKVRRAFADFALPLAGALVIVIPILSNKLFAIPLMNAMNAGRFNELADFVTDGIGAILGLLLGILILLLSGRRC